MTRWRNWLRDDGQLLSNGARYEDMCQWYWLIDTFQSVPICDGRFCLSICLLWVPKVRRSLNDRRSTTRDRPEEFSPISLHALLFMRATLWNWYWKSVTKCIENQYSERNSASKIFLRNQSDRMTEEHLKSHVALVFSRTEYRQLRWYSTGILSFYFRLDCQVSVLFCGAEIQFIMTEGDTDRNRGCLQHDYLTMDDRIIASIIERGLIKRQVYDEDAHQSNSVRKEVP
jgi:hypothetical protein